MNAELVQCASYQVDRDCISAKKCPDSFQCWIFKCGCHVR